MAVVGVGVEDGGGVGLLWLPRGLDWGVGVRACEGEGEGVDDEEDLVLRDGMRACWAVREAKGPCRGPWEVFMGGG